MARSEREVLSTNHFNEAVVFRRQANIQNILARIITLVQQDDSPLRRTQHTQTIVTAKRTTKNATVPMKKNLMRQLIWRRQIGQLISKFICRWWTQQHTCSQTPKREVKFWGAVTYLVPNKKRLKYPSGYRVSHTVSLLIPLLAVGRQQ